MDLFKLEPGLAIWTWISFGILFFILWKLVLPVLLGNISKREELISSSVDNAEKIEIRLGEIQSEREEILSSARKEADELLHRTRSEAEVLKKELLKKAEQEAEQIITSARSAAEDERTAAIIRLRDELADFICDVSDRITGFAVTGDRERQFARESVKSL